MAYHKLMNLQALDVINIGKAAGENKANI